MKRAANVVTLAVAIACGSPAFTVSFAQEAVAPVASPRFDITRFEISGNTLIALPELSRLVAPYQGGNKDFGDVQRALEAVEQAYRARGFGVVQVLLPEQDITRGTIKFAIVEPKVGRVVIEGNKYFDGDNIRRSLPSIREGKTPNSRAMSRNLQMLGEHPAKQTSLTLKQGATEDQVDVGVKVDEQKPLRYFFTLDNTGTSETGYFRSGIGFQHSNLFNKDHTLTAQYITSPTNPNKVTIAGGGYRIPFYGWNSSLDLVLGYSDVNSGSVQGGLFNVSGSGWLALARWNYYLPRWGEFQHKLTAGLDIRKYTNDVTLTGNPGTIVPDLDLHPISLTYSGSRRYSDADLNYYATLVRNLPWGGDGDANAFNRPGLRVNPTGYPGAEPEYTILRYGATYVQALGKWQVRAALNAQYTPDLLSSYEQFGLGGPDSVRGYLLREMAGDRGYNTQLELYTPDVAATLKMSDSYRLRFLGFYDYGSFQDNQLPRNLAQERGSIYSVGLGLRMNYQKLLSLRLDLAQIMKETLNRQTDSTRLTGSVAVVF